MPDQTQDSKFSLEKFEYLCYSRQHEPAAKELVRLLALLDSQYGQLGANFQAKPLAGVNAQDVDQHLLARMAGAISSLFADPEFMISEPGFLLLMPYHRWISTVFAAGPYRNADHVIRSLNTEGHGTDGDGQAFRVAPKDYFKFCLLYSPESEIPLDVNAVWNHNKIIAASLFLTLMSPRFLGTPAAHSKRELLLGWLPEHLPEVPSLDPLPLGILHDVYMHCSYADLPQRHNIKAAINVLIRRKLEAVDIKDRSADALAAARQHLHPEKKKPVMLVLMEWFTGGHSIYRTHSLTLEGAREKFHVIGMGYENTVDELGRAVFDEFIPIARSEDFFSAIRMIVNTANQHTPAVFYMPSVGMFPITMFMCNLRIAPLQVAALGHPATTRSDKIDFISVEDDFVGDPACFSETLMRLPKDGQPYRPSASSKKEYPEVKKSTEKVKVAVAATTMKLNPRFLLACRRIADSVKTPMEFHFLVGQAQGLVYPQVNSLVKRFLNNAVVHQHQPYEQYMATMNECHMFLSPFPFGNTNGIVDAATLNLPGVNLSGAEVFEHIDEGLFGRLGLPDWLTAKSFDDYVAAAVKLIDEPKTRDKIAKDLAKRKAIENIFKGNKKAFGEMCADRVREHPCNTKA
jgi:hypothetical protein